MCRGWRGSQAARSNRPCVWSGRTGGGGVNEEVNEKAALLDRGLWSTLHRPHICTTVHSPPSWMEALSRVRALLNVCVSLVKAAAFRLDGLSVCARFRACQSEAVRRYDGWISWASCLFIHPSEGRRWLLSSSCLAYPLTTLSYARTQERQTVLISNDNCVVKLTFNYLSLPQPLLMCVTYIKSHVEMKEMSTATTHILFLIFASFIRRPAGGKFYPTFMRLLMSACGTFSL